MEPYSIYRGGTAQFSLPEEKNTASLEQRRGKELLIKGRHRRVERIHGAEIF